jgi:hypothetical protein
VVECSGFGGIAAHSVLGNKIKPKVIGRSQYKQGVALVWRRRGVSKMYGMIQRKSGALAQTSNYRSMVGADPVTKAEAAALRAKWKQQLIHRPVSIRTRNRIRTKPAILTDNYHCAITACRRQFSTELDQRFPVQVVSKCGFRLCCELLSRFPCGLRTMFVKASECDLLHSRIHFAS